MSILKALIGGLIGAIIATVILMYLRHGTLRGYEWFPIVTGIVDWTRGTFAHGQYRTKRCDRCCGRFNFDGCDFSRRRGG